MVIPFIKLSSKCIKTGIEGSADGNPILSQIYSRVLGSYDSEHSGKNVESV